MNEPKIIKNDVIIMRGISGSGKSTYVSGIIDKEAEELSSNITVCSADDYFSRNIKSEYRFNPNLLSEAHHECFNKFIDAINHAAFDTNNKATIIIDNTNTELWEMSPYVQYTKYMQQHDWNNQSTEPYALNQFNVRIIEIQVPGPMFLEVAHKRNIHGVNFTAINRQWEKIRESRIPFFWDAEVTRVEAFRGDF